MGRKQPAIVGVFINENRVLCLLAGNPAEHSQDDHVFMGREVVRSSPTAADIILGQREHLNCSLPLVLFIAVLWCFNAWENRQTWYFSEW